MTQFATSDELATFLGRDVDADRADLLLRFASAAIQNAVRQRIEYVEEDTIQLHPAGSAHYVLLPELPVVSVKSVLVFFVSSQDNPASLTVADFEVTRWGRVRWPLGEFTGLVSTVINAPTIDADFPPTVQVTYTHGYDPVPDDVRGVCLAVAARAMLNPEGMASETIDTYVGAYGDARGLTLTPQERADLSGRYRQKTYGEAPA